MLNSDFDKFQINLSSSCKRKSDIFLATCYKSHSMGHKVIMKHYWGHNDSFNLIIIMNSLGERKKFQGIRYTM